jgi:superfamily I DNA/RNA helicase
MADNSKQFVFSKYHTDIENFIINNNGKSFIVNAGPGSGKTTTGAKVIVPNLIKKYGVGLAIAFNNKNASDLKTALAVYGPAVTAGTVNSICQAALNAGRAKRYTVEAGWKGGFHPFFKRNMPQAPSKAARIASAIIPDGKDKSEFVSMTDRIIDRLMQAGFGIDDKTLNPSDAMEMVNEVYGNGDWDENLGDWICEAFNRMEEDRVNISLVEQIYRPIKEGVKFPAFKWVLFDEGQDMTPLYSILLKRFKENGAVVVVIGDERQAINSFMGAMENALPIMENELNAASLPLSISYRCSKAAVIEANKIFPGGVEAHEGAKQGEVNHIALIDLNPMEMMEGDAIISRVHKYLLPVALSFIKERVQFKYKGAVDIVSNLKRLVWKAAGKERDCGLVREKLSLMQDKMESDRQDKFPGAPLPGWITRQRENVESLIVMLAHIESEGGDTNSLNHYFDLLIKAENGKGVSLSTFHAAKGMEWSNVFIVGPMESSLAKTEKELAAEKCVAFVAVTRSSDKITFVSV